MRLLFILGLLSSILPFLASCDRTEWPTAFYMEDTNTYVIIDTIPVTGATTTGNDWIYSPEADAFRFYLSENMDSMGSDYIDVVYDFRFPAPIYINFMKDSLKNVYIQCNSNDGYLITKTVSNKYKIRTYTSAVDEHGNVNIKEGWSDSTIIKNPHYYCIVIDPYDKYGMARGYEKFSADSIRGIKISKVKVH